MIKKNETCNLYSSESHKKQTMVIFNITEAVCLGHIKNVLILMGHPILAYRCKLMVQCLSI